jgi:hypothetical protein
VKVCEFYKYIIVLVLIFFAFFSNARAEGHLHPEKYYQKTWCDEHGGVVEYVLDDRTRVDCLTDEYAIEFDFAAKWAESIGQALFYGLKTNRKPSVVLIMEHPEKDQRHLNRLRVVAEKYSITVWQISNTQMQFRAPKIKKDLPVELQI